MKNLWISMGENIHIRNLVEGAFLYQKLSAEEVSAIVQGVVDSGGELSGCFDFGSVASKKKTQTFKQLLKAFKSVTGVELEKQIFAMKRDDDEPFPNFNFIPTVTNKQDMLVVEYYFNMDISKLSSDLSIDKISSVSNSSMDFHLLQVSDK